MMDLIEQARKSGAVVETHASWVILGEQYVYKLKKPVNFGFLDFSTPEQRQHFCTQELTLNSRLAADVYLKVVPVRRGPSGVYIDDADAQVALGQEQLLNAHSLNHPIVDWAVKMRRLNDADRADVLLSEGRLDVTKIRQLADLLVQFHASCSTDEHIASFGKRQNIEHNLRENFDNTRSLVHHYMPSSFEPEIEALQLGYLTNNESLLDERVRDLQVRDGHGDLRLEHVYFTERGICIIDCIEFNERFRYADTVADLAFLTMDLRHHLRSDLAEVLLNRYVEKSGDYCAFRLIDFYESYRAYVRAKVTALRDRQGEATAQASCGLATEVSQFFGEARAALQAKRGPRRVIAVGGLIASGKSTVARQLATRLSCVVLDSDSCRKRLAGLDPVTPAVSAAFSGIYSDEITAQVYSKLLSFAQGVLRSGRSLIMDATFRRAEERERLRQLCAQEGVSLSFIWCEVPRHIAEERLAQRALRPGVSDGRAEIYEQLLSDSSRPSDREFDNGAGESQCLVLDTSLSAHSQQLLLAQVGTI